MRSLTGRHSLARLLGVIIASVMNSCFISLRRGLLMLSALVLRF
jgi:hypothetical protein